MSNITAQLAVDNLITDFNLYLSEDCVPDDGCHEASLEMAEVLNETLAKMRVLGAAIENGDPQDIANLWLSLKDDLGEPDERDFTPGICKMRSQAFISREEKAKIILEVSMDKKAMNSLQGGVCSKAGGYATLNENQADSTPAGKRICAVDCAGDFVVVAADNGSFDVIPIPRRKSQNHNL